MIRSVAAPEFDEVFDEIERSRRDPAMLKCAKSICEFSFGHQRPVGTAQRSASNETVRAWDTRAWMTTRASPASS